MRTPLHAPAALGLLSLAACEQPGLEWHGTGSLSGGSRTPPAGEGVSAIARPEDRTHSGDRARPEAAANAGGGVDRGVAATAPTGQAGQAGQAAGPAPSGSAAAPVRPGLGARLELQLGAKGAGLVRIPGPEPLLAVALESPGALLLIGPGPGGAPAVRGRTATDGWCLPPVVVPGPDGRPRIALASRETARLSIVDPGALDAEPALLELPGPPVALAAGDLGADGTPELLVLTRDSLLIAISPDGAERRLQLEGQRGTFLHVAADGSAVHVGWQLPRGLTEVPAALLTDAPAGEPRTVALAGIPRAIVELDLDRDGDLERAVAGGDRDLWAFGLEGAALDDEPRRFDLPGDLPIALAAHDLDGDGDQELLSINRQDSNYGVIGEWSSAAQRFDLFTSEYAGQSPLDLELCDLSGDGAPELCIVGRDSSALGVTRGRGQGNAGAVPFVEADRLGVGPNPIAVAAADVDGDGRAEAVALCGSDGSLHVLGAPGPRATGTAPLAPLGSAPVGKAPRRALLGVLPTGAPALAALLAPTEGSSLVRLTADANGTFTPAFAPVGLRTASDLAAHGPSPYGAAGSAAVVVDPASGALGVLPADGSEPAWFPLELPGPAAVARIDGARLAVAGGVQGRCWIALLDLPLGPEGRAVAAPTLLDRVDLEGWPIDLDAAGDIAYLLVGTDAGLDQGRLNALRIDGSTLTAGPATPTGARPARVAAGDLDRDGLADAAVAAQNSHRLELTYLDGAQLVVGPRASVGLGPLDVALADLDGDGWLDLLSANAFSNDVSAIRTLPPGR